MTSTSQCVIFKLFISSCVYDESPLENFDRILIHSLPNERWSEPALKGRLCGGLKSFQVVSEGPSLQVTFLSLLFSQKDQGFAAEYVFVRRGSVKSTQWGPTAKAAPFEQRAMTQSSIEFIDYMKNPGQITFQDRGLGKQVII